MLKSGLLALLFGAATVLASPLAAQQSPVPGLDREALRAEIRAYLLENPEVIYEAIQLLEEKRRAEQAVAELDLVRQNREALVNDGYSHVGGNPDGTLTIVEFFDYRCGYCKKAHPDVTTLLRTDGNIRLIRKEFPILGPDSVTASRAAIAAQLQGDPAKYSAFSDSLMAFGGPMTDAVIDRLAGRAGVDVARMRTEMTSPEVDRRIAANQALAEKLKIGGTPTFIIGDKIVRGFLPLDEMTKVVELARAAQN